jgi:hypothetical protein
VTVTGCIHVACYGAQRCRHEDEHARRARAATATRDRPAPPSPSRHSLAKRWAKNDQSESDIPA